MLIHLNDKTYAIGMRWRNMGTLKPRAKDFLDIARSFGIEEKNPWGVYTAGESGSVVGFIDSQDISPKEKIYSLAATLASKLEDGIYVARIEGYVWVLAIIDGMVSPSTDQYFEDNAIESQIAIMRTLMPELSLFIEKGISWGDGDVREWSLSDVLGSSNVKHIPIIKLGSNKNVYWLAGGGLALLIFGGVLWSFLDQPKETPQGPTPAEIEAQQRAAYISSIQGLTATAMPDSAAWVDEVPRLIKHHVVQRYGWSFEGADCNTQNCVVIFTNKENEPFALDAFLMSLGQSVDSADIDYDKRTLRISEKVSDIRYIKLDEQGIINLPAHRDIIHTWKNLVSMAPIRLPGIKFEKAKAPEDFSMHTPPPPGLPGIVKGTLAVSGVDTKEIPFVLDYLSSVKAMPTRLAVSYGLSELPAAWRIELTYLAKK